MQMKEDGTIVFTGAELSSLGCYGPAQPARSSGWPAIDLEGRGVLVIDAWVVATVWLGYLGADALSVGRIVVVENRASSPGRGHQLLKHDLVRGRWSRQAQSGFRHQAAHERRGGTQRRELVGSGIAASPCRFLM